MTTITQATDAERLRRENSQLRDENDALHAEIVRLRGNRTQYVSIRGAAELLAVNTKTIRRRIADGTLPASRVAGTAAIRIRRADLARLVPGEV